MTLKLNTDNRLQGKTTRTTGYNTVLSKMWLIDFDWTFVQGATAVILLNFGAKIPAFVNTQTV